MSDCLVYVSGWWFEPCTTDDECAEGPCLDLGDGTSGCAMAPSDAGFSERVAEEVVDAIDVLGTPVSVCGSKRGYCLPFRGEQLCAYGDQKSLMPFNCNDPGEQCEEGEACAADGRCVCTSDAQCVSEGKGDFCGEGGYCTDACDDVSDCPPEDWGFYDGGQIVCEPRHDS